MKRKPVYLIVLFVVLMGVLGVAFKVQRVEAQPLTVYIRANGDVDPSWVPIQRNGDVYTFTGDIQVDGDATGMIIERDNMTLNGAGYSLSRPPLPVPFGVDGIELMGRYNVTIMDLSISQFYYSVLLGGSSNNTISGNNMTNNDEGIHLEGSHDNLISGNNIEISDHHGIYLEGSHNNTISENQVIDNTVGVIIYQSSNNTILGNNITIANTCVYIRESSSNTVFRNNITHANYIGVRLHGSSSNIISENYIANNDLNGIQIDTSGNKVYNNNFVGNAEQAHIEPGNVNIWDDGYPSGGNYWSDYNGTDSFHSPDQNITGSDGIGDNPCVLDSQNNDSYPLMGPITFFDAGTWDKVTYFVQTVSNSTVSDANFSITHMMICFNITGPNGTIGFSRVRIPKKLLYSPDPMNWEVKVNNTQVPFRVLEEIDGDYTYIYLTYKHDAQQVQIIGTEVISEFPLFLILPLFMIATLLAVTFYRRKHPVYH